MCTGTWDGLLTGLLNSLIRVTRFRKPHKPVAGWRVGVPTTPIPTCGSFISCPLFVALRYISQWSSPPEFVRTGRTPLNSSLFSFPLAESKPPCGHTGDSTHWACCYNYSISKWYALYCLVNNQDTYQEQPLPATEQQWQWSNRGTKSAWQVPQILHFQLPMGHRQPLLQQDCIWISHICSFQSLRNFPPKASFNVRVFVCFTRTNMFGDIIFSNSSLLSLNFCRHCVWIEDGFYCRPHTWLWGFSSCNF